MTSRFFTSKIKLTIICLLIFNSIYAQDEEVPVIEKQKSAFWKKVSFGGGLGLNFSNGFTNITIAPNGIYKVNEQFGVGVGLNANYSKHKNNFEATVLGASLLSIFKPIQEIQLSVEFEENNINLKDEITNSTRNYWNPALFLGAGYSVGDFGAIGVRYDVLYNDNKSPYGTALLPFVRFYF